jgi:tetratricopeptide (TPR) repeat protein
MQPPSRQTVPPQAAKLLADASRKLQAGRPAEAVPALREAARWQPGNAALLHDLGLACLQSGQVGEAIGALRAAVAADPRYADAHLRLGIALEAAGALEAALAAFQAATEVLPSLADARYRAGDLLDSLGRSEEASQAFRRAAASAPKTSLGRIAAARARLAEGRDVEAEKILRQALALDRSNAIALDLLGTLLADWGRFDEAETMFLRAIDLAPLRAGSFYEVVRGRRIGKEDGALLARMQAACGLPGLDPSQRSRVHLALGKAADDLGDYQTAMRHFDAAEALRNSVVRFDARAFEARVDQVIGCFTAEVIGRAPPPLADGARPILIVGLPRSGTTLVEQIFAAHRQVHGGGELAFWNEQGRDWQNAGAADPAESFLRNAAAAYRRLLHGLAPGRQVTDKNPLNFQWAGLIHMALPDATIIHCRRAPIDTALSIHRTHFSARMSFPTGGAALVSAIGQYQRLMAHWRRVLPAERFIEIEYEALTANPEPVIRRMLASAGLDWDEACLRPEETTRPVRTPSKWQARQKIHPNSAGSWRRYEPWLGALRVLIESPES